MSCGAEHQWTGTGRRTHSSGRNPLFRCTREAGHDGPHAYERQPRPELAPVLVADLPLPRAPRPVTPKTLATVRDLRARFGASTMQPMPTTEDDAQAEVARGRLAAAQPTGLSAHYYRRWLDGGAA